MSGVVKGVGNVFVRAGQALSGKTRQAVPAGSAQGEAPQPAARAASAEEKSLALRRRRGTRSLLSQERLDAESAVSSLAGQKTTLGGM
jgi:hypothetical protein